jgi:predicted RecB family nuclease
MKLPHRQFFGAAWEANLADLGPQTTISKTNSAEAAARCNLCGKALTSCVHSQSGDCEMQLSGTDFYRAYRPSECDLRIYLHHKGVKAADPGPYEEVIRRLGDRHERKYLATFQGVLDLTQGTGDERQAATLEAMRAGVTVIYQPMFTTSLELAGQSCNVVGIPDFLIREGDEYVIRDVKMTRRIAEHPEILWQLRLYGWLFERATGRPALRLEVFNGRSELIAVEPEPVEDILARLAVLIADADAPFEPVGWSRCGGCGYNERCWGEAKARDDVAMVLKVDKALARALRAIDVVSYGDLLSQFDEAKLSAFEKPWGKKTQKVGKAANDNPLHLCIFCGFFRRRHNNGVVNNFDPT